MFRTVRRAVACRSIAVAAVVLLGASIVSTARAAKIDPEAEKLVQKVSDYYAGLKAFRSVLASSMKISSAEAPAIDKEMKLTYDIAVDRPKRLSAVLKAGSLGATVVSDGKQLFTYSPETGKYSVQDAPATVDDILKTPTMQQLNLMKTLTFFGALVSPKPYEAFMEGVESATLAGTEEIDGVKCQRVKLEQEAMPWEMWVEMGDKPIVKRIAPDLSSLVKGNPRVPEDIKLDVVINFTGFNPELKPTEDDFKFTPPADAKQSDSPFGEPEGAEQHALLGKPAPGFELALLDGGKLKLVDHKDKQVVILDFWATWCGPCVAALPTITEVANKYKAQGVAFYAVNLRETPEEINGFLKEQGLKMAVALDVEGAIADKYGVTGIPQTVIVGKDGSVQVVHVGLSPDLKEKLTKELEDLLAGKKLAGERK